MTTTSLRRRHTILLLAGVCALAAGVPSRVAAQAASPAAPAPVSTEAVDKAVQALMQARQFPAASVAVVRDGTVLVARGYGLSDVETATKATEHTVYQLASLTKPFTAQAILLLAEDGKLSLDGKITEILPNLPASWAPVTVRHLLTHTSGLKSYTDVFGAQKTPDSQVFTADQILALVKDVPPQWTPGARYAYCNTGYYLLGLIVEKVSGKPYGAFVQERIFKPLGMTATAMDDYADARPIRAKGYTTAGGRTTPAPHTHPSQPYAAGGLVSSVVDLAKWDAALSARKLLKPASYDAMWTPMTLADGKPSTYALGWIVEPYRGRTRQSHGGGISGFSTYIARFPDDKLTIVALINQGGGAAGALANALAELYIPELKPAPPKPAADPDPKTTAFLKEFVALAAKGETKAEWLTPQFQEFMLPDRIKQGAQMMGRHGELAGFDFLEDSIRDDFRLRVYRATFGTTPMRIQVAIDQDGKIGGLLIRPIE